MFSEKEVIDYINSRFIFKLYNLDIDKSDNIKKNFNISGYPTFIFLNGEGEPVAMMRGTSVNAKVFIDKLDETLKFEETIQGKDEKLKNNPSYLIKYVNYLTNEFKLPHKLIKVYNTYLNDNHISETFASNDMIKLYFNQVNLENYAKSPILKFAIDNKKEIISVIGKDNYNNFMEDKIDEIILELSSNKFPESSIIRLSTFVKNNNISRTIIFDFISENNTNIIQKRATKLFKSAEKYMKSSDGDSKTGIIKIVLNCIIPGKYKEYMDEIISLFETRIKFEDDEKTIKMYNSTLERIKQL